MVGETDWKATWDSSRLLKVHTLMHMLMTWVDHSNADTLANFLPVPRTHIISSFATDKEVMFVARVCLKLTADSVLHI